MSIPGENLLLEALDLIASQPVTYYSNTGRTTTGAGIMKATLAPGVLVSVGSVQAVPRNKFEILGLDYEKNYVYWFVPRSVVDAARNLSGDQFDYGTKKYQVESITDWYGQDGWISALAVQINNGDA